MLIESRGLCRFYRQAPELGAIPLQADPTARLCTTGNSPLRVHAHIREIHDRHDGPAPSAPRRQSRTSVCHQNASHDVCTRRRTADARLLQARVTKHIGMTHLPHPAAGPMGSARHWTSQKARRRAEPARVLDPRALGQSSISILPHPRVVRAIPAVPPYIIISPPPPAGEPCIHPSSPQLVPCLRTSRTRKIPQGAARIKPEKTATTAYNNPCLGRRR
ncbi:hypothetical protein C8Q79DRAFT_158216 [Trametes meyenii]|nr:hypothetical protein C8Q79DRAFT_158216 [Trametes meyenii]